MLGRTLNLGILAHVDAGKTTLTERLLYAAGVIRELGSVDRGTTQTDTLALERQRGITIKSAVVSFPLRDTTINLIDTPGHPDFIAEVERVLGVLDGAVLVVSAVEGVQAQTRVLWRALARLGIPTLFFVNKTDRVGADPERVAREIAAKLTAEPVAILAGSAIKGDGIEALIDALTTALPPAAGDSRRPAAGTVFKIERAANGEKVAYVRLFDGTLRARQRVHGDEKITAIHVFENGRAVQRPAVVAGQIATVRGLRTVQIGDHVGDGEPHAQAREFARPTLQTVVSAADQERLHLALTQLAEQDPLIAFRQSARGELLVSLYGEVQKEVIEATLTAEYGLEVSFSATSPILVERPLGTGEGIELLGAEGNRFHAQLGLRVEPADGIDVQVAIDDHTRIPLYIYKRREEFDASMDDYVRDALREGLHGWEVIDCAVTVFDSWYSLADGPPSRRGPMPTAADFRALTPVVLRRALEAAGTIVCEPFDHVRIEVPVEALGPVIAAATRLGAEPEAPELEGDTAVAAFVLPSVRVADLQRSLPGLSRGEGVLESSFLGYRPAVSAVPG
ncbi:MAG TPA: translation factor GTPase family protein [Gaiellaceae bacterium]|nr:translation factor GTPase family protein [Gaiellaceae bacterium]